MTHWHSLKLHRFFALRTDAKVTSFDDDREPERWNRGKSYLRELDSRRAQSHSERTLDTWLFYGHWPRKGLWKLVLLRFGRGPGKSHGFISFQTHYPLRDTRLFCFAVMRHTGEGIFLEWWTSSKIYARRHCNRTVPLGIEFNNA